MTPAQPLGLAADRSRTRTIAWAAVAALAASLTAVALARTVARSEPPPVLAELPAFSLLDKSGDPLTAADMRGRIWVADFVFTTCAGACPTMTARMARLQRKLPDDVWMVSFTVDPAHDTPEVLTRYAQRAGAGPRWLFVTGKPEAVYALAVRGFKLAVEAVPPERQTQGEGPFLHSSHFVLVDAGGRVRGYYDSTDERALGGLVRDVAALRANAAPGPDLSRDRP